MINWLNIESSENPVIVLGMHRSGTTMTVKVLERLGVFMGCDQEVNSESKHFLRLNDWLVKQGSTTWDNPEKLDFLFKDVRTCNLLLEYLKFYSNSILFTRYLGVKRYFGIGFESDKNKWGWKDPRNTYTIEFWLKLFPNARIIVVERNGLDVANSLVVRREKYLSSSIINFNWKKYIHLFRFAREPFGASGRVQNLDDGIELWYKYLLQGRAVHKKYSGQSYLLKYEEFLKDPQQGILGLSEFLKIDMGVLKESVVKDISATLDSSRANAISVDSHQLNKSTIEKLAQYEL